MDSSENDVLDFTGEVFIERIYLLPRGYDSDRVSEGLDGRVYSSILGKYINPKTGEIIEDENV